MTTEITPGNDELFASRLADYHLDLLSGSIGSIDSSPAPVPDGACGRFDRAQSCVRRLEQLRNACQEHGAFRLTINGASPASDDLPGTESVDAANRCVRFGRFIILDELGAGAHGVVYRAVDPVLNREVALKLPRIETIASPVLRERFVRESRIVASLHHPNLLPVFEVGEVGAACYVAFQLCHGPTLAQWLDQHRRSGEPVSAQFAAGLVAQLADTVQYVHQHGVLHRDVKPANILLEPSRIAGGGATAAGSNQLTPKLTDFGVARQDDCTAPATRTGAILGTPAYMAPEQADGRVSAIGPATDVYGLGAVLYELLTGRPPFQESCEWKTLLRVVEGTPPCLRQWRDDVPGDLESVCLKCLEHAPSRRYASAAEFAADLRRFLNDEPVQARPVSRLNRAVKWSRRRPLLAGLACSLAACVVASLVVVTWMWRNSEANRQLAEQNLDQAHHAVQELLSVVHEGATDADPRFNEVRDALLRSGIAYYRRFLTISGHNASLQADTAEALYRLGFIATSTGSKTEALAILQESLPIWEQLGALHPASADDRYFRGKTVGHIGQIQLELGRRDAARASFERAAEILNSLADEHPASVAYCDALGEQQFNLSQWHAFAGDWDTADEFANEARRVYERLLATAPDSDGKLSRMLANCYCQTGAVHVARREYDSALEMYRQAAVNCEVFLQHKPGTPAVARQLAGIQRSIGDVHAMEQDLDQALTAYERSRSILEPLVTEAPNVTSRQRDLGATHFAIGTVLLQKHEPEPARAQFEAALGIRSALLDGNPDVPLFRRDVGRTQVEIGKLQLAAGEPDAAAENLRRGAELMSDWVRLYPNDLNCRMNLSIALQSLATAYHQVENHMAAERACRQALEWQRQIALEMLDNPTETTRLAEIHILLATQLRMLGRDDAAQSAYCAAIESLRSLGPDESLDARQRGLRDSATDGLASDSGTPGLPAVR